MNILRFSIIAGLVLISPVFADTIAVSPANPTVSAGQMFLVDVDVSGISDLGAFQFDVDFNPALLSATGVTEGAFFSGVGVSFIPGTINNSTGTISDVADALAGPGPGPSGSGILAAIDFEAISSGASTISLSSVILLDSNGHSIPFTTTGVPEPRGLAILGFGIWLLGRRRRALP